MRVIGYIRVSTGRQAKEGTSLRGQEDRIRAWAKFNGADKVEIFSDPGRSGRRGKRRPGVTAALAAIGKGDVLAAYSLSRIGRSSRDLLELADAVRAKDADLVSMCEDVSTKGPAGRMFFTVLAAIAQYESEITGERVAAMWHDKRGRGEKTGGCLPFGYGVKGKKLFPHAAEQAVIAKARGWRSEGSSLRAIAGKLEAQGIQRKAGGRTWSAVSVSRILTRMA
jgi:site-specific DNA recombinase